MNSLPAVCPLCSGTLVVREAHCRQCDTTLTGTFEPAAVTDFAVEKLPVLRRLAQLSPEQLTFLEAFIRCEGKLNRMQEEVGLSYPTLRARLDDVLRSLVRILKEAGASPFIVPSMGSHGGATAEGQVEILRSLGVTEESVGAPIRSSMDVVEIGETGSGVPVYMDRIASEADGVVIVGRIKQHTDFRSGVADPSRAASSAAR